MDHGPGFKPTAAGATKSLLVILILLGLAALGYAGFLVYVGITSDEMFAGLGVILGALIGAPAVATVAAASGCLWLLRRDPGAGRTASIALGALIAVGSAALGAPLLSWAMVPPFLLGGALLAAAIASPAGPALPAGSAEAGAATGWGSSR